ncbi:hypothetical protein Sjap_006096 [Stephania japonica]|uniref:Uncharacterized protein n=1 Tax=Stephania japonica TaxID=461633 RepID=A0AAP0K6S3_9MAGN
MVGGAHSFWSESSSDEVVVGGGGGGCMVEWEAFGAVEGLDRDELREAAYEVFFTACRSSPGFGGRNALSFYSGGGDSGMNNHNVMGGIVGSTKIKRLLGLKSAKRMLMQKKTYSLGPNSSPKIKRPFTSAEIMRHQMRVSEHSDHRLRKTLMRTLMGRRAETVILPLELLRHLKPSEFNDTAEYHLWQKRQLKLLQVGLVHCPLIPLHRSNSWVKQLREIVQASDMKPIDTGKNSETMQALCNCVISLSCRTANGTPSDVCHWADGSPLNVHLYLSLLNCIFDAKDQTLVLDEVDELLELMKKTWPILGINKFIHNVCFTWILFQQYIATGQVEQDLLGASLAVLAEVTNDVSKADKEHVYGKILSVAMNSIQSWSDQKLLSYHENFQTGGVGLMENILPLTLSATKIINEELVNFEVMKDGNEVEVASTGATENRVDLYIRSSLRNAFAKRLQKVANLVSIEVEDNSSETLLRLAEGTEELALEEKDKFSPVLKKWHPIAAGIASMTLHNCYGLVLQKYLADVLTLTNEAIEVLKRADKLEKDLVQVVVEDSVDCEDGGRAIIREMVPYEIDNLISSLLKTWIDDRMKRLRECLERAKDTETWNPKSKTEPHAQSVAEIMRMARETVEDFFEIPVGISNELVMDLVVGLELVLQDYISFIASCGSKQNYIPQLPPLTRCSQHSKFIDLWKKAAPCKSGIENKRRVGPADGNHPRPSTSRGTQRLYIRLNSLYYILSHINSLDKLLVLSPRQKPLVQKHESNSGRYFAASTSFFGHALSSIQTAIQYVSEVAAYRLIFLDSNFVFYECLYLEDVVNARIRPALRILKQNLTLLCAILADKAQPLAVKEVMRATFEAFLMVLLAGGGSRIFSVADHDMIEEDFDSLKRVFCSCGEGLIGEESVEKEAETVEGVLGLMVQSTEQLVEDFSIVACEVSGLGVVGSGQKVPMPPTTGRWNRADPNTILRHLVVFVIDIVLITNE